MAQMSPALGFVPKLKRFPSLEEIANAITPIAERDAGATTKVARVK
jgi:hypothetical protein